MIYRNLMEPRFVAAFEDMAQDVHDTAVLKGWWDEGDRNDGELIALMHSELSEALEGLRHGNKPSDHISTYSAVEEEFADVVIRIMDMAKRRGWRIGEAVAAKAQFNRGREHKHGGKKF